MLDQFSKALIALLHFDGTNGSTTLPDSSNTAQNALAVGTAAISTAQSKFGGASLKTGSANGNYAKLPACKLFDLQAGDFTVEGFVWPVSQGSGYGAIIGRWDDSAAQDFLLWRGNDGSVNFSVNGAVLITSAASVLPTGAFAHVAVTRSGTTATVWVNGVSVGTATLSAAINCTVGAPIVFGQSNFSGGNTYLEAYYDEWCISTVCHYTATFTTPTAAYNPVDQTVLLLHGDSRTGVVTFDSSPTLRAVTMFGTANVNTTQKKFGAASIKFDGTTTCYATTPHTADLDLLTGDFTIEGWVYPLAYPAYLLDKDGRGGVSYPQYNVLLKSDGTLLVFLGSGTGVTSLQQITSGTIVVPLNQWSHFAVTRQGTTIRTFANGVLDQSVAQTATMTASSQPLWFGGETGQTGFLNGYLDEVRITKGVALYTATFTPPTAAFPDSATPAGGRTLNPAPAVYAYTRIPSTPVLGVSTDRSYAGRGGQTDQTWGGKGRVAGQTTVNNTPTPEKVRLIEEGGAVVQSAWADASGNYVFDNVNETYKYQVLGRDYSKTYNAVVQDNITPVLMPLYSSYPAETIAKFRRKITMPQAVGLGNNHAVLLKVGESASAMTLTTNVGNAMLTADVALLLKTWPTAKGDYTGDINFTDVSGNNLPYWLERITGTSPNRVFHYWVNLGSQNLDSGNAQFYVVYNGATIVSSSGAATFPLLFDDFLTTFDATKWQGYPNNTVWTVTGGAMQTGATSGREVRSVATFGSGYEVFGAAGPASTGGGNAYSNTAGEVVWNFGFVGGTMGTPTKMANFYNWGSDTGGSFFGVSGETDGAAAAKWTTTRQANAFLRASVARGADGSVVANYNDAVVRTATGVPSTAVNIGVAKSAATIGTAQDYVAVRKYVPNAPAIVIGYEEIAP